jgi:hypothetical protein
MVDDPRDPEQRVRLWAYHLWERDGRPFGRDHEFWERAKALAGNDNAPAEAPPPPADRG